MTVVGVDDDSWNEFTNSMAKKSINADAYSLDQPGDESVVMRVKPIPTTRLTDPLVATPAYAAGGHRLLAIARETLIDVDGTSLACGRRRRTVGEMTPQHRSRRWR